MQHLYCAECAQYNLTVEWIDASLTLLTSQWRKCCGQNTVKLLNNIISKISLKPYRVIFNDTISDRHASHRSTAGIYQKRPVASRFAWTKYLGAMLEAYRKLHPPKTQISHRTSRSIAGDLEQPATETDQQGCWLNRCRKTDGEQFEHKKWLWHIRHHSKMPLFKQKTFCFGASVFQRAKVAKWSC